MSQRIRIKLKSYDYNLVDKSAEKIVKLLNLRVQWLVVRFHFLQRKNLYCFTFSTRKQKAREQFQLCAYKRLLDIYSSNSKTVDALMKLELPSGVEVEIKV